LKAENLSFKSVASENEMLLHLMLDSQQHLVEIPLDFDTTLQ